MICAFLSSGFWAAHYLSICSKLHALTDNANLKKISEVVTEITGKTASHHMVPTKSYASLSLYCN